MFVSTASRPFRGTCAGLVLVLASSGCSSGREADYAFSPSARSVVLESAPAGAAAPPPQDAPAVPADAPQGAADVPTPIARKIIYNGSVALIVPDLSAAESRLVALVEAEQGYVSETNISGSPGSQRSGTWTLRVPSDRFASFMAAVSRLGELQSTRTDSQDVTQEFYDLEARISVKTEEEKRLIKILDEASGKLKDILEIEKELSRVRSEIEQMQGRLRYLSHQTSLSTVTVQMTEIKDYEPPVAPTLGQRIGRTFSGSLEDLVAFLEAVVLAMVALTPWLVLILPGGLLVGIAARRAVRRLRAST